MRRWIARRSGFHGGVCFACNIGGSGAVSWFVMGGRVWAGFGLISGFVNFWRLFSRDFSLR